MLGKLLVPLSLISVAAAREFETVIPDWTKWVFFFAGAIVICLLAWAMAFGSCLPVGPKLRAAILLFGAGCIAIYGYFFFGPWWTHAIRDD